jgi:biotin transport system substrate-specific component
VSTPTLTAGSKATVLVDLLPQSSVRSRAITRDIVLVLGFALLTAAAAQVQFSLGFTPVPLTGQTFAVLLSGAALGMRRGIASQAVYWGLGLTGLPFYAGGDGGWQNGTGSTLGYFVGFIVAAGVVGKLAERRHDREVVSSLAAMAFGTVIIYAFGALWLAHHLNIPVANGEANLILQRETYQDLIRQDCLPERLK